LEAGKVEALSAIFNCATLRKQQLCNKSYLPCWTNIARRTSGKLDLKLDALSDLYLKDFDKARLRSIRGLLILVFIIILLASINFMNLATARLPRAQRSGCTQSAWQCAKAIAMAVHE
jgi:hypothetical protein